MFGEDKAAGMPGSARVLLSMMDDKECFKFQGFCAEYTHKSFAPVSVMSDPHLVV